MGCKISRGPGGHGEIIQRLNNAGDTVLSMVSIKIQDMRVRRNKADYDLENKDIEEKKNAEIDIRLASRILQDLEKYFKEPLFTQVRNNIMKYERDILNIRK